VAKALGADSIAGFTGTVQTQTDLGLPSLGSTLGPSSGNLLTTLLAPHTIKVWYAQGGKVRLAIPDSLAETDVVSDGTQLWVWQSATQTVSHLAKKPSTGAPEQGAEAPDKRTDPEPGSSPEDLTPPALAAKMLANADPTTRVFVRGTAMVAGRPAYELVLAPRTADTLVADAVIDVDSATGLPLQVQILARDSSTPALQVGFTSLTLNTPADSNFTFTVPPGATMREVNAPEELLSGPQGERRRFRGEKGDITDRNPTAAGAPPAPTVEPTTPAKRQIVGAGWDAVAVLPNAPGGLAQLGTPVSGAWGTGRLVTSKLVEALILPDGQMLVGLVPRDRLEAVAGQIGSGS
jgi:outer membrane lipoprotein-sorting protein